MSETGEQGKLSDTQIASAVRIARKQAWDMYRRCGGRWSSIEIDDLTSAAFLGVAQVVRDYDPEEHQDFLGLAWSRIHCRIIDE